MGKLSYKTSGVDVAAAERLVDFLKTKRPEIGGYSGLYPLSRRGPILAATTDGVGTKLKLAFMLDRHCTIGVDLVAMVANDLVAAGARPLFFLDYYAVGRLDLRRSKAVLAGILEGCRQAEMVLLGGETAEMPGVYKPNEYDLAGFAVGVVERKDLPEPARLRAGDRILGLPSTGVHSNGYSLVRKALSARQLRRHGPALMKPTRIYVREAARLRRALGRRLLAGAHITGGGLFRNLGRILPKRLDAVVESGWKAPAIFEVLAAAGVPEREMWRTFNMGIGMAFVVRSSSARAARRALPSLVEIGRITSGTGAVQGI